MTAMIGAVGWVDALVCLGETDNILVAGGIASLVDDRALERVALTVCCGCDFENEIP